MIIWKALVYDTGALIAAERSDETFRALHRSYLEAKIEPVVPSPVLTQAWRGTKKQTPLHKVLRGCRVEPVAERIAKDGGVLLGKTRTSDAVDAVVVATAACLGAAAVLTSDPDDIQRLVDATDAKASIRVIPI